MEMLRECNKSDPVVVNGTHRILDVAMRTAEPIGMLAVHMERARI
jgi:hypothetical protein